VEALILTLGLGMERTGMAHFYPQSDEPGAQSRVFALATATPRGPVIRRYPLRQAIATEGLDQDGLNRFTLLIAASLEYERETGMVVEYGQGIATTRACIEVPLEVHLLEKVGGLVFKALPSLVLFTLLGV